MLTAHTLSGAWGDKIEDLFLNSIPELDRENIFNFQKPWRSFERAFSLELVVFSLLWSLGRTQELPRTSISRPKQYILQGFLLRQGA